MARRKKTGNTTKGPGGAAPGRQRQLFCCDGRTECEGRAAQTNYFPRAKCLVCQHPSCADTFPRVEQRLTSSSGGGGGGGGGGGAYAQHREIHGWGVGSTATDSSPPRATACALRLAPPGARPACGAARAAAGFGGEGGWGVSISCSASTKGRVDPPVGRRAALGLNFRTRFVRADSARVGWGCCRRHYGGEAVKRTPWRVIGTTAPARS